MTKVKVFDGHISLGVYNVDHPDWKATLAQSRRETRALNYLHMNPIYVFSDILPPNPTRRFIRYAWTNHDYDVTVTLAELDAMEDTHEGDAR